MASSSSPSSSRKVPSSVLKRLKAEAKRLAEIDYQSNLCKNKSAYISRQTGRHYERLLKKHYEDAERSRRALQSSNESMRAGNAQLRRQVANLSNDVHFHELQRKLDDRRQR